MLESVGSIRCVVLSCYSEMAAAYELVNVRRRVGGDKVSILVLNSEGAKGATAAGEREIDIVVGVLKCPGDIPHFELDGVACASVVVGISMSSMFAGLTNSVFDSSNTQEMGPSVRPGTPRGVCRVEPSFSKPRCRNGVQHVATSSRT